MNNMGFPQQRVNPFGTNNNIRVDAKNGQPTQFVANDELMSQQGMDMNSQYLGSLMNDFRTKQQSPVPDTQFEQAKDQLPLQNPMDTYGLVEPGLNPLPQQQGDQRYANMLQQLLRFQR